MLKDLLLLQSTSNASQSETSRTHLPELSTTPERVHISGSSTPGSGLSHGYGGFTVRPGISNAMENDSQRSYRNTPFRNDTLLNPLRIALQTCESNEDVQIFLPDDKLSEIMTTENVHSYLSENGSLSLEQYNEIFGHICGKGGRTHVRRASRRIFAILLLIEEPQLITDFIKEDIHDDDLPLSKVSDGGNFLARGTRDKPVVIEAFCHWTYAQRETFFAKQWQVQTAILHKGRRATSSHPVHKFDKDVILPWTEHKLRYDGHSDVFQVKIHHAHCRWHVDVRKAEASSIECRGRVT